MKEGVRGSFVRVLIQRVRWAQVDVENQRIARIERGILVFLAVQRGDTPAQAQRLVQKVLGYRIFSDNEGKMNLSIQQVQGAVLVVSQFTLAADTQAGTRPSFSPAAPPELGLELYEHFISGLKQYSIPVETGQFGADMQVSLQNDGPVTFLLEA